MGKGKEEVGLVLGEEVLEIGIRNAKQGWRSKLLKIHLKGEKKNLKECCNTLCLTQGGAKGDLWPSFTVM